MFDISIAQFKKHFVFVCVIISFSITGIIVSFKEFLSCRIFPLTNIDMAYNASFLFFMAIGIMLPQWVLGALLWSEQRRQDKDSVAIPRLPTGRADLQTVTLVLSGVMILFCLVVVLALFWQGSFYQLRTYIYNSFFLSRFLWVSDSLLIFLFTGLIWLLCGIMCALLYRMALSLTTQTGQYQTLEQRFNILLAIGYIAGMVFWQFLSSLIYNCGLLMLLSLVPLIMCAFWLPANFSRSAERSYIKHYELKKGVQQRSYLSGKSAAISILLGGILFGSYVPLASYLEQLSGFGIISHNYFHPWSALFLLAGWYYSFKRDNAGKVYPQGVITPLYRWSVCCLGLIFSIALSQNQPWCRGLAALIIWQVFMLTGLFFLGDVMYCLKQIMPRAIASVSLGWVIWVVMMCLGILIGKVIFVRLSLPLLGSLLTVVILFFGSMITNGVTIIFTTDHDKWHRSFAIYSLLPIIFSTLIIFWVTQNWILYKNNEIVNYCETIDKTWAISLADRGNFWFRQITSAERLSDYQARNVGKAELTGILQNNKASRYLLAGSVMREIPGLDLKNNGIKCDIIAEQAIIYLPELVKTRAVNDFGVSRIYWNFEQMFADKLRSYDLICVDTDIVKYDIFMKNPLLCRRLLNKLTPDGMFIILTRKNAIDNKLKELRESINRVSETVVEFYTVSDDIFDNTDCRLILISNPNHARLRDNVFLLKSD